MKFFHFIPWLVLLIRIESAGAQSTTDAATLAHLKKFRNDCIQALTNQKPDLIQPYYAEKIRMMPEFQKTVLGKDNVALYYKAFVNRFTITNYVRQEMEIVNLGPQVLEIGKLVVKLQEKSNGQLHELQGTYLNLWEKSSNGKLMLLTEAWNYSAYYGDKHDLLNFAEVPSVHIALLPNVPVNSNISFELNALARLLDATVTQHDALTWTQFYAPDAMLIPNHHPACIGKQQIDAFIQDHVEQLPVFVELDIRSDRLDNLGNFVVEYSSHVACWKKGDGSGVNFGKNIRIWRREADHSLKIFRSIAMYD